MSQEAQGEGAVQTLEGDSLLDEILSETKMSPGDEGYEVAKAGVQAFIAELVPREELPNAIALNSALFNAARFIGPALAGGIIAVAGEGWAFLVSAASFAATIMRAFSRNRSFRSRCVPGSGSFVGAVRRGLRALGPLGDGALCFALDRRLADTVCALAACGWTPAASATVYAHGLPAAETDLTVRSDEL